MLALNEMEQNINHMFATGVALTLAIILVGVLISFAFVRFAVAPVQAMATATTKIEAGREQLSISDFNLDGMLQALDGMFEIRCIQKELI